MRRKKRKQIQYIKKRKQTENGKTPGSKQPVVKSICGSLTMRRRVASVSSYIVECTTFKLEGIRYQERSTLHEHCIKIAQAKKGPSQTDGARLEKLLMQQQREYDSSKQQMSLLRRQGRTRLWISFFKGMGAWNQFITSVCVFIWQSFHLPLKGKKMKQSWLPAFWKKRKIKNTNG